MGKLVTVSKLINDECGELRNHIITVDADAFMGSLIEYSVTKVSLIISLGSDTLVLRCPISQESYLRELSKELLDEVIIARKRD